ncbi:MAG: rod shape-determining protein MreD [Caldilineaceae bacterium]
MNRGMLFYAMIPLVLILGLLQSTAAARLEIRGVKPDLVLLVLVVATLVYGSRSGLIWAFVGGIVLDIFSGGPMGASSLALMAAVLIAGLGHRTLSRFNLLVPLGAIALGTAAYGLVYLGILQVLDLFEVAPREVPLLPTIQYVVVPAAIYNVLLMLLIVPFLNRVPESQDI